MPIFNRKLIGPGDFTMKARIVEQLGETEVLVPSRIAAGLAANDRAKVCLSALQAAAKQASNPAGEPDDLSAECAAAGIDASDLRSIVAAARANAPGVVAAPGLARLINALFEDIDAAAANWPPARASARKRR